jgi:ligand-binding sensor domain-containing protein
MHKINSMVEGKSYIWCATEGGLLSFDPVEQKFSSITNTEGLATNDLTTITTDQHYKIWIGSKNGLIQKFDPAKNSWFLVEDYAGNEINHLSIIGDTLLVGLDIGVSIYNIHKVEVKETYRQLGNAFQIDTPVREIMIFNNEIWAATDYGIAYTNIDNVNLMDPQSWTNVTHLDGIPQGNVTSLVSHNEKIYVGTTEGIAEWDGNNWTLIYNNGILDLIIFENSLYAASNNQILNWNGSNWVQLGNTLSNIMNLSIAFNQLWTGSQFGLYNFSQENFTWQQFIPNCISSNIIQDLAVDNEGNLLCGSFDNGFSLHNGKEWIIYNRKKLAEMKTNDVRCIAVDNNNNKWFGTWGGGIIFVGNDSTFKFFNAENGYLAGVKGSPLYSVVSDITFDQSGTMWILNTESMSNQPLISVTTDSVWTFYGTKEGISTSYLNTIAVDIDNNKWIGSNRSGSNGIFILDDNNTPQDKNDDPPISRITLSTGLNIEEITDIAIDRNGIIWIGTTQGLHSFYWGFLDNRYFLPSDNIRALAVDGMNNLWVGLNTGVSFFSESEYAWSHFHEDNSDLVSNEVTSITVDSNTGLVYIGTNKGISIVETLFSEPKQDLEELLIYPVPFLPEKDGNLIIDNLAWNTVVHIYNSNGFLVKEFPLNQIHGKRLFWNGKDDRGRPVSTGIYLVVAKTERGDNKTGKFALIR